MRIHFYEVRNFIKKNTNFMHVYENIIYIIKNFGVFL